MYLLNILAIILSFVELILGLVLIGLGTWMRIVDPTDTCTIPIIGNTAEEVTALSTQAYLFMSAGLLITLFTFVSLCGARKAKTFHLGISLGFIVIASCFLFGIGVWVCVGKWMGQNVTRKEMIESLEYAIKDEDHRYYFDLRLLQNRCGCCGVTLGIEDYRAALKGETEMNDELIVCEKEFVKVPCIFKIHLFNNQILFAVVAFGVFFVTVLTTILHILFYLSRRAILVSADDKRAMLTDCADT